MFKLAFSHWNQYVDGGSFIGVSAPQGYNLSDYGYDSSASFDSYDDADEYAQAISHNIDAEGYYPVFEIVGKE